jgi:hypothetical protein
LEAEHALLMDRVQYRRIDYETGRTYHVAEADALSPAILPTTADGAVDEEIMGRLEFRHDDSEENVENRLKMWDKFSEGLRSGYEDVSLRLAGAQDAQKLHERIKGFVEVESTNPDVQVSVERGATLIGVQVSLR